MFDLFFFTDDMINPVAWMEARRLACIFNTQDNVLTGAINNCRWAKIPVEMQKTIGSDPSSIQLYRDYLRHMVMIHDIAAAMYDTLNELTQLSEGADKADKALAIKKEKKRRIIVSWS